MRRAILRLGLALVTAASSTLAAQAQPRPELLIVGSYHMANRNHDVYNMRADDVSSPDRQRQVAQVIEVLKKFRPTKIAIEADIDDGARVDREYAEYRAGTYTLSRDETNQLGYRLARELGHPRVYPVNAWAGNDFPLSAVGDYAKARGQDARFRAIVGEWGAATQELDDYLKAHSVLETLEHANSDAFVAENMGPYFEVARLGEPGDYAGPDLLGNYYLRNIRIYRNIVGLIASRGERILVVYGYGHLGWLREIAHQDQTVRLRTLNEFAR
ncbi:hypothetical protein tb265_49380 [Gemmatimonadetes bacterium T265]|nr:hypothetical protein tb265_49380 [Gemmatimonadetes bacterium T265]